MARYEDNYRQRVNDYWYHRNRQLDRQYNQIVTDRQTTMDRFRIKNGLTDYPPSSISNKNNTITDHHSPAISNKKNTVTDIKSQRDELSKKIQRQLKKVIGRIHSVWKLDPVIKCRWENDLSEIDLFHSEAEGEIKGLYNRVDKYAEDLPYSFGNAQVQRSELGLLWHELRELERLCATYHQEKCDDKDKAESNAASVQKDTPNNKKDPSIEIDFCTAAHHALYHCSYL